MKQNISDILDDYQDDSVVLGLDIPLSSRRIKELTMEKIQEEGKYRRRGNLGKLLIVAAVISALAVPVLAVNGFLFEDWSNESLKAESMEYDENPQIGSVEKTWAIQETEEETVCNWAVTLIAEDVSETGLTFLCTEVGGEEKGGTFAASDGYWLEKWDGEKYVPMNPVVGDGTTLIRPGDALRWKINWEDVYGSIESGSYRIGKEFTYTSATGKTQDLKFYAKFRVLSPEIGPLFAEYADAYERLCNRENLHILLTHYIRNEPYAYRTEELWQAGDDYLLEYTYYNSDGSIYAHGGHMYRDGVGYSLEWTGDDVASGVSSWANLTFVDASYHKSWIHLTAVNEALVGQVCGEGNSISFFTYLNWLDETELTPEEVATLNVLDPYWNHDYTESIQTFDSMGNIIHIEERILRAPSDTEDCFTTLTLEVFDTTQKEIRDILDAVDVSQGGPFSWERDCEEFMDAAIRSGFRNTVPVPINSAMDALRTARVEAIPDENPNFREFYEYNVAEVFFDENARMWKVHFYFSQDKEFALIVYLSTDGVTKMMVLNG